VLTENGPHARGARPIGAIARLLNKGPLKSSQSDDESCISAFYFYTKSQSDCFGFSFTLTFCSPQANAFLGNCIYE
jgi:hypothetical protein